jgi:hypothetical protein
MKALLKALFFGFLLWLVPFIVSFLIYPLKEAGSPLFETIMPVVLSVCAVFFSVLYFRKVTSGFVMLGILLGAFWFAISVVIDLLMFSWGPMKMGVVAYFADIGLAYLIYPAVTVGTAVLLSVRR